MTKGSKPILGDKWGHLPVINKEQDISCRCHAVWNGVTLSGGNNIQWGLVLRLFVLRRFTFTTLVQSDQALLTCGASLSQFECPLSLLSALLALFRCACVFFFFYFSAVLLSWLWFFHPWRPSKRQKRTKNQNSWHYNLSWRLLNHGLGLLQQNIKGSDWYFF